MHIGCVSPFSRYVWVRRVWPIRSLLSMTSSLRIDLQELGHTPSLGCIAYNLLCVQLVSQLIWALAIKYLVIQGLKSEYGIFKGVMGKVSAALAAQSACSLPFIPIWLGTQQNFMFLS